MSDRDGSSAAKPRDDPPATDGGGLSARDDLSRLQDDQRRRWARGERVLVEVYLRDHQAMADRSDDLLDLIYHEVVIREECGEEPSLDEYLQRFPRFEHQLRDQFAVHRALDFTELLPPPPSEPATPWEATLPTDSCVATGVGPSIPGYEVIRELGRGGMGVVYLAWQNGLNRLVALKMIVAGGQSRHRDQARFRGEALAVARLEHPNLVRIYETGEVDGYPYFSMEYVDGSRLSDQLKGTPMPPKQAAQLLETLARATQAAHDRGVIHRDLKPSNILFSAVGDPKIVDFGLAKLTVGGRGRTITGDILGSPSYMAPEQAAGRSKEVGPAADVYALGAILYDMLTGRPPFKGESFLSTLALVINEEPVAPCLLQPGIPGDLEKICLKCLMKEAGHRYPSAAALADDVHRYLTGDPVRAQSLGLFGRAISRARQRPVITSGVALIAAVMVVALAFMASKENQARTAWLRAEIMLKSERDQLLAAEKARSREAAEKRTFQQMSVRLLRDSALRQCEDGDTLVGLSRLIESLKMAPEGDHGLQEAIRANIAGWQGEQHSRLMSWKHTRSVLDASWSRDGDTVLTVADREASLWNVQSGSERHGALRLDQAISMASFSPDGRFILASAGEELQMFAVANGQIALRHLIGLGTGCHLLSYAFTADSQTLWTIVLGRDANAWLKAWSMKTGQALDIETPLGGGVARAYFSPNGAAFVVVRASRDEPVQFWRTAEREPRRVLKEQIGGVSTVAFRTDDGQTFVTGSDEQTGQVWDGHSGEPIGGPIFHSGPIHAVAISRDSARILIGGENGLAQLWNATTRLPVGRAIVHPAAIRSVEFSRDGRHALTVSGNQVRILESDTAELSGAPLSHANEVIDAKFSPDGKTVLTRGRDRVVRVWSAAPAVGEELRLRHPGPVTALAVRPGSPAVLTGCTGASGTVLSWDVAPGQRAKALLDHCGPVLSLAYRPDGAMFAAATADRHFYIQMIEPHAARGWKIEPRLLNERVLTVAFHPDGKTLVTGTESGRVEFWDVATRQKLPGVIRHDAAVACAAFSPDGGMIAIGCDDATARLYDVSTQRPLASPLLHAGPVVSVAFQPPLGRLVLTGSSDGTARMWELATGQPFGKIMRHPARVLAVAFSPEGQTIATGCGDGIARLWSVATGDPVGRRLIHQGAVRSVCFFNPRPADSTAASTIGGWNLMTGSDDATARVWPIPGPARGSPDELLRAIEISTGAGDDGRTGEDDRIKAQ